VLDSTDPMSMQGRKRGARVASGRSSLGGGGGLTALPCSLSVVARSNVDIGISTPPRSRSRAMTLWTNALRSRTPAWMAMLVVRSSERSQWQVFHRAPQP